MRFINALGNTTRKWREAPTLFFKFTGTAGGVKEQIDVVRQLAKGAGGQSFDFARDQAEQTELWSARKDALWSTMAQRRPGDHMWTGDVAVPMSRLPDIIEETKKDLKTSGLTSSLVGHVGDGNFHSMSLFSGAVGVLGDGKLTGGCSNPGV
jgi:D-lactate dehydrogenase (cytochrome)